MVLTGLKHSCKLGHMFERFTNRARHVIVLAQEEARRLRHNYIGTEHILLGLLGEPEGLASRALTGLGMSLEGTRQEVMDLVVSGLLNKQVGFELGISEITVKAHRGQVMRKMEADSLADLVTMAGRLGLGPPAKT